MNDKVKILMEQIEQKTKEINKYRSEISTIQKNCLHSKLPNHEVGKPFQDSCPDCGILVVCYYNYTFPL